MNIISKVNGNSADKFDYTVFCTWYQLIEMYYSVWSHLTADFGMDPYKRTLSPR